MKVNKILIKRFRGFRNVEFELGTHLTVLSGQNGTQKTTVLGMLSQPFSNTKEDNPMREEKPLCGGSFKSAYSEKFKFSEKFDNAGEHEWTLFFRNDEIPSYTVESIHRDKSEGTIRLWKKGDKSKDSGYIQFPVIYLSLKRLLPIGEDLRLKENKKISITDDEFSFYKKWHNKILILTRDSDKIIKSDYLSSSHKQTLGVSTNHYDWKANSAGQDNIGKILLAIMSFRRLQEKYNSNYKGGILAIDEIDATFYAGSQVHLIDALNKFASKFKIQIILTTHSLTILKQVSKLQEDKTRKDQVKLIFFKKVDEEIKIESNISYDYIRNDLNLALAGKPENTKVDVYTEDRECAIFVKSLLGPTRTKHLNFIDVSLGCGNLIDLASRKIPTFIFPNSIIVLDGDVKNEKKQNNRVKRIKNILLLPTNKSPEQIVSQFLNDLSDTHSLWKNIDANYSKQYCFQYFVNDEIQNKRSIAKEWFNSQLRLWGRNATKVLTHWKNENNELVNEFNNNFAELYNDFVIKLEL